MRDILLTVGFLFFGLVVGSVFGYLVTLAKFRRSLAQAAGSAEEDIQVHGGRRKGELAYDIDTLLHGLKKFEDATWTPPAKWVASDRVAFLLRTLFAAKLPLTSRELGAAARRAGDIEHNSSKRYHNWCRIMEKEGMVASSTRPGTTRPHFWTLTMNRKPMSAEKSA